jgi:hypothetical protein
MYTHAHAFAGSRTALPDILLCLHTATMYVQHLCCTNAFRVLLPGAVCDLTRHTHWVFCCLIPTASIFHILCWLQCIACSKECQGLSIVCTARPAQVVTYFAQIRVDIPTQMNLLRSGSTAASALHCMQRGGCGVASLPVLAAAAQ